MLNLSSVLLRWGVGVNFKLRKRILVWYLGNFFLDKLNIYGLTFFFLWKLLYGFKVSCLTLFSHCSCRIIAIVSLKLLSIRCIISLSICLTNFNCLSYLIFWHCNSACTFSFVNFFINFFFIWGFYTLASLGELLMDIQIFILKVPNCKALPVFCCNNAFKINCFYFCLFHSMSSQSTFLCKLYLPWTWIYSFVTVFL